MRVSFSVCLLDDLDPGKGRVVDLALGVVVARDHEGGGGVVLLEEIQQIVRVLVGAVVERQGDVSRLGAAVDAGAAVYLLTEARPGDARRVPARRLLVGVAGGAELEQAVRGPAVIWYPRLEGKKKEGRRRCSLADVLSGPYQVLFHRIYPQTLAMTRADERRGLCERKLTHPAAEQHSFAAQDAFPLSGPHWVLPESPSPPPPPSPPPAGGVPFCVQLPNWLWHPLEVRQ